MESTPEKRLQEKHLTLPPAPKPMAKYKPAVLAGNLLYVSGHGPAKITDKTTRSTPSRARSAPAPSA